MLAIQRFTAVGAIDAAFWLYRQHFGLLFAISLIVSVPVASFGAMHAYWKADADPSPVLALALSAPNVIVSVLAGSFGTAATTHAASTVALGQAPSILRALQAARDVFARLLLATLLVGFGVAVYALLGGAVIAAISLGLLSPGTTQKIVMGALIVVGVVVPALILLVRWSLIAPVVVVERTRPARALGRSVELTEGRRWKILGVLGLYFIASASLGGGFSALLGVFGGTSLWAQVVQTLLIQATSALLSPILYVAVALLYYDARVEHEAFDVAMLAQLHTPAA